MTEVATPPEVVAATPDKSAILAALAVMFTPADVVELRAFPKGRKRTDAGYFDYAHWGDLADHAARLSTAGAAVYVTINPVELQLLSRYSNRVEQFATSTTTDKQIVRRRWLLVDLDPVRPSNTSATAAQLDGAYKTALRVYTHLAGLKWAEPVVAKSGNGYHLLYPVDLPNDDESTALVKAVLLALADQFDDAQIKVDRSVFNAARICKLYGTVANKGDNTVSAPWRLSALVKTPVRGLVTVEQLRMLAPTPKAQPTAPVLSGTTTGAFSLEGFLARHGMEHTTGMHDGRERFKLASCPFNPEHKNGEAAILRDTTGKLGFHCMHDSCSGKGWKAVRELLDGPQVQRVQPGRWPEWGEALHEEAHGDSEDAGVPVVAEWPELQPLISTVEPVAYPIGALPTAVRCAVLEVAGFVKAPVPLIAGAALAALSLAIQAHTDVQRAERLTGPCSLFLLAVADSGERKTTCDGFFTSAIRAYEAKKQEAAKPLLTAYKSDFEAWEAQRSGIKEKIKSLSKEAKSIHTQVEELRRLDREEPKPPRIPRLIFGDATPEALTFDLAKKWPSGGVISSEAGVVFGGHGMGSESVMRNLATLNQLWDGVPISTSRRSSESFTTHGARLTMALQVQESTIRAFFANTKGLARGTGFLARFLIAWPESTQGTRYFTQAPDNWPALATFNNRLSAILEKAAPIDGAGILTPAMLTFAPDATAAWIAFHDGIESMLTRSGELYDVRDVASKTADNAARLAALFHAFNGSIGPIDLEAMQAGADIAAWHLSEARRFLTEIALSPEQANPARLEAWMLDYCKREGVDKVTTREIQRNGPGALRDKKVMVDALQELTELGRARIITEGKKKLVQINPALLAGVAP